MRLPIPIPGWLAPVLLVAGVAALYAGALTVGFLNDDHLFLEQARRQSLAASLTQPDALANYFRPLSRPVWFELLSPLSGGRAHVFHAANLALLLTAAWLVFGLLRAIAGAAGAWAGTLYFLLLPLQRVNVTWISCSQDLLALVATLAAFALFRAGRDRLALLAFTAAVLSKESALPLPLVLLLWARRIDHQPRRAAVRRVVPFLLPLALWLAGTLLVVRGAPLSAAAAGLSPEHLAAAFVHLAQVLTATEFPALLGPSLLTAVPSLAALALLVAVAFTWRAPEAEPPAPGVTPRRAIGFALGWLLLFTLPIVPVVPIWSGYFYTLAAVGGAMLVALIARRITRPALAVLTAALLWLHAGSSAIPAFAVTDDPWNPGSRLTAHYFERGAALSRQLAEALRREVPAPESGTRFFFATLPPWAGFQMGSGAAVRGLYRDDSLESWFYSQFSDSTAGDHPSVFLFWNGLDFERLYARAADPYFQVGTDLLLLERSAGALHAFRRGIEAGESRIDHLYWLGWAHLWEGQRGAAEQAWSAWGARDDSSAHVFALRTARTALEERDTLAARRALVEAIRAGIGRPVAHAELGALMNGVHSKYALLETLVASRLDPGDWLARRDLIAGLAEARLDDVARRQLAEWHRRHPDMPDPHIAQLDTLLAARAPDHRPIAIVPRPRGASR